MGTGYVRNDTSNNIADGNIINAADLDGEFDAIVAAFTTSGHTHDGTAAEGGPITVVGPVQDLIVSATEVKPKTTNVLDLGTSLLQFKDAFFDGTVTTDDLTVDSSASVSSNLTVGGTLGVTGATTLSSTLDVTGNGTVGGTFDATGNSTIGGTLGVTGATTLSSTLGVTGNSTIGGTLGVLEPLHYPAL